MNIDLSIELSQFLEGLVTSGRFSSTNEAVGEGIRLLMEFERIRAEVQEGIDQLDRGEWFDADEVFDELEAELNAKIAKQQASESNAAG